MLDKTFKIALLISLGMHSVVLAPWSKLDLNLPKKPQASIEVTYFRMEDISNVEVSERKRKIVPPEKTQIAPEQKPLKKEEPAKARKEKPAEEPLLVKKATPEEKDISTKRLISKKSIQMQSVPDLEGNISYMSYSQLIREKIRQHLYRNYAESMGEGEVTVNFILISSGALKALEAVRESSTSNRKLQDLCVRSIKQASPFKPFPEGLDLPQISFKITISFERD